MRKPVKLDLLDVDRYINDMMERFDWNEATPEERRFLINLCKDLVGIMEDNHIDIR